MSKQTPQEAFNIFGSMKPAAGKKAEVTQVEHTQNTEQTQHAQYTQHTQEGPVRNKIVRNYRLNMAFDSDLEDFIKESAWRNRVSITEWLNMLVRQAMEAQEEKDGE